jgi:hypothetical protein
MTSCFAGGVAGVGILAGAVGIGAEGVMITVSPLTAGA